MDESTPHQDHPPAQVDLPSGPVDLVEQHFTTRWFGGYDKFQVHEYLVGLAREWESLLSPARTSTALIEAARSHAAGERPYEALGEDLSRILAAAKDHATHLRAEGEAAHAAALAERDRVLSETVAERDRVLSEASSTSERVLAEAEAERRRILEQALAERDRLEASNAALREHLTAVVSGVSPLLSGLPASEQRPSPAGEPAPALVPVASPSSAPEGGSLEPYPAGSTATGDGDDTMVLSAAGRSGTAALDLDAPTQVVPSTPSSRRSTRR